MTISGVFINGCSFLTSRPKDGVDTHTGIEVARLLGTGISSSIAMGGRGNDRISFTTKLWYEKNTKSSFALIGWSSTHRHDYLTDDGWKKGRFPGLASTWRSWKTADNLRFINQQLGWDVDQQGEMRYIDHVLDLQNYFKLNQIPYVMYNSLPNKLQSKNADLIEMASHIDKKRFFNFESSHYDYVMKEKEIVSPNDPHPSTQGHIKWAQMIKEFIDVNDLRTV